jgi:hypothetical protein
VGNIKEIHGGTLTVELKDGGLVEYQMNIVEKYTKGTMKSGAYDKNGSDVKKENKLNYKEAKDKLVKKLKEALKGMKKEGDVMQGTKGPDGKPKTVIARNTAAVNALTQSGYKKVPGAQADSLSDKS